jgi:hypothetical protein
VVRKSLGDRVEDVLFYTDSKVAQCWVLNTRKRLRMFVHNRVQSIRHAITQAVGSEEIIPLYHIEGTQNLADMVTKPRKLSLGDIDATSSWKTGLDWMRLPTEELPKSQHTVPNSSEEDQIVAAEAFPDVENYTIEVEARRELTEGQQDFSPSLFFSGAVRGGREPPWLEQTFDFLHFGWRRAKKRLATVWRVVLKFRHGAHKNVPQPNPDCCVCTNRLNEESESRALLTIMRTASSQAEAALGSAKLSKKCTLQDGIWYSSQRLEREGLLEIADLDFTAFYDGGQIKKLLPVVLSSSSIFQAFVLYIHFEEFPHQGVESTLARIKTLFCPTGDPRGVIAKVKKACSKCRILLKQVVGLELADIHSARTTIAPPFYAVQMDIAMGFKGRPTKDSRKSFPCHALVIVCLLTSATSIMVIDGLETQSVIQALEHHAMVCLRESS